MGLGEDCFIRFRETLFEFRETLFGRHCSLFGRQYLKLQCCNGNAGPLKAEYRGTWALRVVVGSPQHKRTAA